MSCLFSFSFFFFNDTATTEIYTLSLHDALPISRGTSSPPPGPRPSRRPRPRRGNRRAVAPRVTRRAGPAAPRRSEEHTSELQSLAYLVCRLLLEKKKKQKNTPLHMYPSKHYPAD